MSSFLFHNKFHRSNHHTLSAASYPDSAIDPIASADQPFLGTFFNYAVWNAELLERNVSFIYTFAGDPVTNFDSLSVVTISSTFEQLTASAITTSRQWHSAYTYINQLSSGFNLYVPVYTTTKLLSGTWQSAYSFYTELNLISTFFDSTYVTTSALSARWPNLTIALRLPQVQSNLRSKVFAGTNVQFSSNSAFWDLDSMQVGFAFITGGTIFKNIVSPGQKKKGGEYTLVLQQDGFGNRAVNFESDYIFGSDKLQDIYPREVITYGIPFSHGAGIITTAFGDIINSNTFASLTGEWDRIIGGSTHVLAKSALTTKWYGGGNNASGQLGVGDTIDRGELVPIDGEWDNMVCGYNFTFAQSANTNVWYAVGSNYIGQLGIGDTVSISTFAPLTGEWSDIKCGTSHTVAKSAGTNIWFGAGDNSYGQLGLGAYTIESEVFMQIPGEWSYMTCGSNHTMAQSAGTYKWYGTGDNIYGQLGLNSLANNSYIFIPVVSGNWEYMVCGENFTFAQESNTKKWSGTGRNNNGQLALGNNLNYLTFTAITGSWDSITCGENHILALSAGTYKWYAAGLNSSGQLGIGSVVSQNVLTPVPGQWIYTYSHPSANYTTSLGSNPISTFIISGPTSSEIVSLTALSVTVIRFVCDGERLFGKPTQYYYLRDAIWTYFAGDGITLNPNPAELYIQEALRPRSGVIVLGTVLPAQGYSAGTGITILSGVPS